MGISEENHGCVLSSVRDRKREGEGKEKRVGRRGRKRIWQLAVSLERTRAQWPASGIMIAASSG